MQMMQMQMMSFEGIVGEHKYLDTFQIVMKHLLVNPEKNELRDQVELIFKTRETELPIVNTNSLACFAG